MCAWYVCVYLTQFLFSYQRLYEVLRSNGGTHYIVFENWVSIQKDLSMLQNLEMMFLRYVKGYKTGG